MSILKRGRVMAEVFGRLVNVRQHPQFAASAGRLQPVAGRAVVVAAVISSMVAGSALGANAGPSSGAGPVLSRAAGDSAGRLDLPLVPSAATQGSAAGLDYQLVNTWHDEPHAPRPGLYAKPLDLSSDPNGVSYLLDGSHSQGVHVIGPDGTPTAFFGMPEGSRVDDGFLVKRLDVGFDGAIYVLSEGARDFDEPVVYHILRFDGRGALLGEFELVDRDPPIIPTIYWDISAGPDGQIYLARTGDIGTPFITWPGPTATPLPVGSGPSDAIDVYEKDGRFVTSISPKDICHPIALDHSRDGTLYVSNVCPVPWNFNPPTNPPAPRPSGHEGTERSDEAPEQPKPVPTATPFPTGRVTGVLVLDPLHRLRDVIPFDTADDIAAGIGDLGVFVSRIGEIFKLREWDDPIYVGPTGRVQSPYFNDRVLSLDVTIGGKLNAAMDHCYYKGLMRFAAIDPRPATPTYAGIDDSPRLNGPVYPVRAAASEDVAVLSGLFTSWDAGDGEVHLVTPDGQGLQTVQRWSRQGQRQPGAFALPSQLGLCGDGATVMTGDVAIDQHEVYTLDPEIVTFRADDTVPTWYFWPKGLLDPDASSRLVAIDADDGRAAILDVGAEQVFIVSRDKQVLGQWGYRTGATNQKPVDIALRGDNIYLADGGRNRVMRYSLDGKLQGEFTVHDGPQGLDVDEAGNVFMLGRSHWAFRYGPNGALESAWQMPDVDLNARDIAVDVDGRVYVPYFLAVAATPGAGLERGASTFEIDDAGVWVFEAVARAVPPPVASPGGCLAFPDKYAAPPRIPLGSTVQVTLEVRGRCPGNYEPAQIVLAVDTSRSMNEASTMKRAQSALTQLLDQLDPRFAEVALVTFDDGAALVMPLTRDLAAVRARVNGLQAWGDTRMAAGLDTALQEITGSRANPLAERVVILVTDGEPKDVPLDAAKAIWNAGIEMYLAVYPHTYLQDPQVAILLSLVNQDEAHILMEPTEERLRWLTDDLMHFRPQAGLFETITIQDVIPDNMRYLEGSAVPPATHVGNRLIWTLGRIQAAEPIHLTYHLRPLEVGTWPTNVVATAAFTDALKTRGDLLFPIPKVEVYELGFHVYLPLVQREKCLLQKPTDVIVVLDTSSSMRELAADGKRTKLDAAREAAAGFLDLLNLPSDEAALVSFNREAHEVVGLTGDNQRLKAGLAQLETLEGTRIDYGLQMASQVLSSQRRSFAQSVVVLLTDGLQNGSADPVRSAAAALKSGDALVYTIGLGNEIDRALLAEVASSPDRFYASPTDRELQAIYAEIRERVACDVQKAAVAGAAR